ncbi:MAG: hypothetical protein ACFHU9_02080 [Fluviicola sp.]
MGSLNDLDQAPQFYTYIVLGIKYESKWYIQKRSATYFDANDLEWAKKEFFNNLQGWNFFKVESTEFNPDFWETYFFSIVKSSVEKNKDKIEEYTLLKEQSDEEDKDIYQSMIDDFYEDDLKNEAYFGLYTIVAAEIRKQEREQREQFELDFSINVLTPFFDHYVEHIQKEINYYKRLNGKNFAIIYPRDQNILLCPILFEYYDGTSKLHFFVLIPSGNDTYKTYEWTYFNPIVPEYKSMYGSAINEQLNTITTWNFSFDYLEDEKFWSEYVLKKSGNDFEYLQEVK